MCGITGILYFDQRKPAVEQLEKMTGVIHHRGPDDCGLLWITAWAWVSAGCPSSTSTKDINPGQSR
ncbi:MAG: hypothetical protein M0Z31_04805 [Clostridia bacterium]|nr:hypothetical protein [Clostridia bacterium]